MIRSTALILTLGLVGCGLLPTQDYDNNEYELLARIDTNAEIIQANCDNTEFVESRVPELEFDARLLHNYTFHIPSNTEVFEIAKILKDDAIQFKKQYEKGSGNPTYCNFKMKILRQKLNDAMGAVAKKPRG